jgi:hypothetical protein
MVPPRQPEAQFRTARPAAASSMEVRGRIRAKAMISSLPKV